MKNLYTYEMGIYPRKLYICYKPDIEEFTRTFYGVNPDEVGIVDITPAYLEQRYQGTTAIDCAGVATREGDELGVMMTVWEPSLVTPWSIAHEAAHFAFYLCEDLGIEATNFRNSEAFAYIVEWCANKFYESFADYKKRNRNWK